MALQPNLTARELAVVRKLYGKGVSPSAIGLGLSRNESTIVRALKRMGLFRGRRSRGDIQHLLEELKCSSCGLTKGVDEFTRRANGTLRGTCLTCQRKQEARQNARPQAKVATQAVKRGLREAVDALKAHPCSDCGRVYPPYCMEFDHRPGEQKVLPVSALVTRHWKFDRILAEVQKCDLVCVLCHRIRGFARGSQGKKSGSKQSQRRAMGLAFIQSLKAGRSCSDCDFTAADTRLLDFDHRPGVTKTASVGKLSGCSQKHILAEVAKCDLVCVVCHRKRTHERQDWVPRKWREVA